MSPALPVVSGQTVVRALEKRGFAHVSTRGSHVKLQHPDGHVVIVPLHRELALGTLRSVIRQSGLSRDGFMTALEE